MRRDVKVALATIVILGFLAFTLYSRIYVRQRLNEQYAIANLRTINTAEVTYKSSSAGTYGTITDLVGARLLDKTYAGDPGTMGPYHFAITLDETGQGYTATAVPMSPKVARYAYFIAPDAVVHYSTDTNLAPYWQAGKPIGKRQ